MRIVLYNVTTGIKSGGIETYNWEVGRALLRMGHDVTLVTGHGDRCKFDDVPVVKVPFAGRQEFYDLRWFNRKLGSTLRKYLERRSFAKNARAATAELQPDCIVVFKPYDFGFMRWMKRRFPELVVVFRSGGKDFFYTDRFNKELVDVWISCSTYNQKQIESRYGKSVTVIPHGVETGVFRPEEKDAGFRSRCGVSDTSFLIISIGRLVKWKGVQTVVKAISYMENVEMLVIGAGGYRTELERLCLECNVEKQVHFIGEVENYEIAYYLQQSDAYVHPALGEEAFGITLLEAMACGIPVIASNKGAIPDVVGSEAGIVVEARDVGAWQGAIQYLRDNDVPRRAMGMSGWDRVVNNYSWDRSAAALVEAVDRFKGRQGQMSALS